jgi:hypothetical protein
MMTLAHTQLWKAAFYGRTAEVSRFVEGPTRRDVRSRETLVFVSAGLRELAHAHTRTFSYTLPARSDAIATSSDGRLACAVRRRCSSNFAKKPGAATQEQ